MTTTIDLTQWASVSEYAKSHGLSAEYVRHLARTGKLEAIKVGSVFMIYIGGQQAS